MWWLHRQAAAEARRLEAAKASIVFVALLHPSEDGA